MDLEILKIASNTENYKILKEHTHNSKQKNPICGDEMQISILIKNEKVIDFGYQCKSCIYCQASVSVRSKFSLNKKVNSMKEVISFFNVVFDNDNKKFPKDLKKFEILFSKKNLARKDCILLPFKALSKALKS